jgi:hypothetical protein
MTARGFGDRFLGKKRELEVLSRVGIKGKIRRRIGDQINGRIHGIS